jgi:hypothetical protein
VRNEPPSPPLVVLDRAEPIVAHLLAWEIHERDGSWHGWVMWVRWRNGEPFRHVVAVDAAGIRAVEPPEAYARVPRRALGLDGVIRAWSPDASSS